MTWQPVVTPLFRRRKKKAARPLQEAIDTAARAILTNPLIGESKVGALKGVRVYKFAHQDLQYLVAYQLVSCLRGSPNKSPGYGSLGKACHPERSEGS